MLFRNIIIEHADEAPFLWSLRDRAIERPHYTLASLAQLDERVAAHLAGLLLAGAEGLDTCLDRLPTREPGTLFAATVMAVRQRSTPALTQVLTIAETEAAFERETAAALAWAEKHELQGLVRRLLGEASPFLRRLGIAACAVHRVNPGRALDDSIADPDPALRACALRAAGELGRADLLEVLRQHLADADENCRFWAAWSVVLAGDRGRAVIALQRIAMVASPWQFRATGLTPRALAADAVRDWLKTLSADPEQSRALITAVGVYGDPHYVPWLIKQMATPLVARVAGDAFSMITGVLAYQDLEGEWPEGFQAGLTENPEDENVAMDPDEDLPWPAPDLVARWWDANKPRFAPGQRYLCGQLITDEHCREVLRTGYQRQRIGAALELALMRPDRPLFEWRAPAFLQQKLLAPQA